MSLKNKESKFMSGISINSNKPPLIPLEKEVSGEIQCRKIDASTFRVRARSPETNKSALPELIATAVAIVAFQILMAVIFPTNGSSASSPLPSVSPLSSTSSAGSLIGTQTVRGVLPMLSQNNPVARFRPGEY